MFKKFVEFWFWIVRKLTQFSKTTSIWKTLPENQLVLWKHIFRSFEYLFSKKFDFQKKFPPNIVFLFCLNFEEEWFFHPYHDFRRGQLCSSAESHDHPIRNTSQEGLQGPEWRPHARWRTLDGHQVSAARQGSSRWPRSSCSPEDWKKSQNYQVK